MIKVDTFCDSDLNANTYLISKDSHVLIIDPANNVSILKKFIGDKVVDGVLLTHGHYDHFKSLLEVLDFYKVQCFVHQNALSKLSSLSTSYANSFGVKTLIPFKDEMFKVIKEQEIRIGIFDVNIWHTPGHTNCSVIYFIEDSMFSGDTLFNLSIGRTDLVSGSKFAMENTLERIRKIKKDYIVYPGHDESTSLFFEQKNNPYLLK